MAKQEKKSWKWGEGGVRYRRGRWFIRYSWNGERKEETTEAQSRREAVALLRAKLSGLETGRIAIDAHKTKVGDLWPLIKEDYLAKDQDIGTLEDRWNHLAPVFANQLARDIRYKSMSQYVSGRIREGAARSTIRNEIACLRRMMRLGNMDDVVSSLAVLVFTPATSQTPPIGNSASRE